MFGSKARAKRQLEQAWQEEKTAMVSDYVQWTPPGNTEIRTKEGFTYYVEETFDEVGQLIQQVSEKVGFYILTIAEGNRQHGQYGSRVAIRANRVISVADLTPRVPDAALNVRPSMVDPS